MARLIVELEWSDELGESWMNLDNLKLCLYGHAYTQKTLLSAKNITEEYDSLERRAEVLQSIMTTHDL